MIYNLKKKKKAELSCVWWTGKVEGWVYLYKCIWQSCWGSSPGRDKKNWGKNPLDWEFAAKVEALRQGKRRTCFPGSWPILCLVWGQLHCLVVVETKLDGLHSNKGYRAKLLNIAWYPQFSSCKIGMIAGLVSNSEDCMAKYMF